MMFYAALASKREGDMDAIDACITASIKETKLATGAVIDGKAVPATVLSLQALLKLHGEDDFVPFDPISKRTEALITCPGGSKIRCSKGAPQAVLRIAHNAAAIGAAVNKAVDELSERGFRALGVASCRADPAMRAIPERAAKGSAEEAAQFAADHWEFAGIISLYDPPRPDSKATIRMAIENGIDVKMITGDHLKIAEETCRELGLGSSILRTDKLDDQSVPHDVLDRVILEAHGACVGGRRRGVACPRGGGRKGGCVLLDCLEPPTLHRLHPHRRRLCRGDAGAQVQDRREHPQPGLLHGHDRRRRE